MNIMKSKVVFIGAGNMAEAMVRGMVTADFCAAEKIVMTDIDPDRLADLEEEYEVTISTNNGVVEQAEIVVLAVKPQILEEVLYEIAPVLQKETLIISIAAGVLCSKIENKLQREPRVVRVMPNMPALIGQGAAAIAAGTCANEADLVVAEALLSCVGLTIRVEEEDLDAVTALSGSGPAYVFYLIEAMLDAAKQMGLKSDIAELLTLQTVEGAVRLIKDFGESATLLRERVTSKGGTTEAAIHTLDQKGVKLAFIHALQAAKARSTELSR